MQHHYKYGTIGFGVSNKFWDVVFDTQIMPGGDKANHIAASENAKYTK
jgi:sterol desaturase/sphingolipid hydroxylase (fatty acid hydroxylase superfamily)